MVPGASRCIFTSPEIREHIAILLVRPAAEGDSPLDKVRIRSCFRQYAILRELMDAFNIFVI